MLKKIAVFIVLALVALSGTSYALYTQVQPATGLEASLSSIMDGYYGAGNYTRVNDAIDQLWLTNGTATVTSKMNSSSHWLGYSLDEGDPGAITTDPVNPVWLYDAENGTTLNQIGESDEFSASGSDKFVWVLGNGTWYYSTPWVHEGAEYAPDEGMDHMVTFKVDSLADTYVIAWENGGGDMDYQDMIYEVSGVTIGAQSVPEPASVLLLSMGVFALSKRRRRAG